MSDMVIDYDALRDDGHDICATANSLNVPLKRNNELAETPSDSGFRTDVAIRLWSSHTREAVERTQTDINVLGRRLIMTANKTAVVENLNAEAARQARPGHGR